MTGPGPAFANDVPALFMFKTTFLGSHFSQGAAISIMILVGVSVLIVPYLIYSARDGNPAMSADASPNERHPACRPSSGYVVPSVLYGPDRQLRHPDIFALFYLMPIYVLLVTGLKSLPEVNLARMWALPSVQSTALDAGSAQPGRNLAPQHHQ